MCHGARHRFCISVSIVIWRTQVSNAPRLRRHALVSIRIFFGDRSFLCGFLKRSSDVADGAGRKAPLLNCPSLRTVCDAAGAGQSARVYTPAWRRRSVSESDGAQRLEHSIAECPPLSPDRVCTEPSHRPVLCDVNCPPMYVTPSNKNSPSFRTQRECLNLVCRAGLQY